MRRLLPFYLLLLLVTVKASAQIVGTSMFLQGRYLEIGMNNNASFGTTTTPPAGYHPHCVTCFPTTALAEVYDYGHDGWTVGAPPYMGDYTYPGSPFEGWELQANVGRSQAFVGGTYIHAAGGSLTGALTTWSSGGGRAIGNWAGTAAGGNLQVNQETRVDTLASSVVVTTFFKNLSTTTAIPGVYYLRSCDPDNDQTWPGGGFPTNNTVVHQNTDPTHRVMVSATGIGYPTAAYLALGTKDCRAKCFIYNYWSISSGVDLADLWNQTVPTTYGNFWYSGTQPNQDIGIGLVYNIGTIAPGDSAIISYAYIFNGNLGIDSAFPDPQLVLNGVPLPRSAPPVADYDTLDACLYPTTTIFPIDIRYASDKSWSWSHWTWSPAVGLSTTTGVTNTINIAALPGTITYTITGSDSASGMSSCNRKTFYLTIKTCHDAINNSPCEGDTLKFNMLHDTTGDTYVWWGPVPSTATIGTIVNPYKYPATLADSGLYYVVRTRAGVHDTDSTYVIIHPKPTVIAGSNSPLCSGIGDTLELSVMPGGAGESYTWTGPSSFTSTQQFPIVPGFTSANAGVYSVNVTSSYGCKNSGITNVVVVPPPPPPTITGKTIYCYGDPFIPFGVTGSNILWYPSASSTAGVATPPTVNTSAPGTYTFYATQTVGCLSPKDSITVTVLPNIVPEFTFTVHPGCFEDTVVVNHTSTGAFSSYTWNFGDGSAIVSTAATVTHIYSVHTSYNITLTDSLAPISCYKVVTHLADASHSITANFSLTDTICVNSSTSLTDLSSATGITVPVTTWDWDFADGSSHDFTGTPAAHTYTAPGIYPVKLTVTDAIGCPSERTKEVVVFDIVLHGLTDTTLCLSQPLPMSVTVQTFPNIPWSNFSYLWTPATDLSADNIRNPYFNAFGDHTYTVSAWLEPFHCAAVPHVMTIHSVIGAKLQNVTGNSTIKYGEQIQFYSSNEIKYMWAPHDGSLNNPNINNPIATPTVTTTYTVYGMDIYGCLDSASITVVVDSTMNEFVPSGFTPNGDGLNDVFYPTFLKYQKLVEFSVYNRWGQRVFSTSNKNEGWNGSFNGEMQDMGVYYYTIIVSRAGFATNQVYKGEVTLIR